jgi:NADP-dependent 3-hydroxy acid dehydrogenase YdfG
MEAGEKLRVTIISPGFLRTNFAEGVTNPEVKVQLESARDKFAIEQPADVDAGEIVVRPTAQS